MSEEYEIDEAAEQLSADELEQLKQEELQSYYASIEARTDRVFSELDEIASGGSDDSDDNSLVKLSEIKYKNPLNPKTRKNLVQANFLEKTIGRSPQMSATVGKRWISIQAYNYTAFNDSNTANYQTRGAVIKVTKRPFGGAHAIYGGTGIGYDEVVSVEDITQYGSSNYSWAGGTPPNHPTKLTTIYTAEHIILEYNSTSFTTNAGVYNYETQNGAFEVDLMVVFNSGHVEYFTSQGIDPENGPILVPVGIQYNNKLIYNNIWTNAQLSQLPAEDQNVQACEMRGYNNGYYSTSANMLRSIWDTDDYGILTRFKPIHNPAGTLIEAGFWDDYLTTTTYQGQSYSVLNPLYLVNRPDILSDILGYNGIVNPNKNEMQKQTIARLDVFHYISGSGWRDNIGGYDASWFRANYTADGLGWNVYYDNGNYTNGAGTSYDAIYGNVKDALDQQYYFTSTTYYSENILPCTLLSGYKIIAACMTTGDPNYYLTTGKDCYGVTIAATNLPGGANYNAGNVIYVHSSFCCTGCLLYGPITTSNANWNTNDGTVSWCMCNSNNTNPTGTIFSSGSFYTITVTNSSGASVGTVPPAGGTTFTDPTCDTTNASNIVTCNSSVKIMPGMWVTGTGIPTTVPSGPQANSPLIQDKVFVGAITVGSVGIDVTEFTLVDGYGQPVTATATNTDTTFTFAMGKEGTIGALAPNNVSNPYYRMCILDSSGCESCLVFVIYGTNAAPSGCTDSSAVNYNNAAVVDDGSCILCNSTTGLLEDPGGTNTTPLFDTLLANATSATWGGSSHNSDGTLAVSATPIAAVINYMVFDANSKFEILLYKTVNQGDPTTAAGAVQIGGIINAGTLNTVTVASHNFTGLAYGYYTIRVRYVDDNDVATLENCFTEFYGVVQAEVCDDANNSAYMTTPIDFALRDSNPALCTGTSDCCILTSPLRSTGDGMGTLCEPMLVSQLTCDPRRDVTVEWFYSSNGTTYTSLGGYNLGLIYTTNTFLYATSGNSLTGTNWFTVDGYYKVKITATVPSSNPADTCIEEQIIYAQVPTYGCPDPTAHNYDPSADCPGPCAYPSWDCDQATGTCIDPWNGTLTNYVAGPFNCLNGPGCCNSSCQPPTVDGCTDTCATNFDPTATSDDGSCMYTACLDPLAPNTNQNCCNQNYYSPSQIIGPDNSCCLTPCANQLTVGSTVGDAGGTCTTFVADGTVILNVTISWTIIPLTGANLWTWKLFDSTYTNLIYTDPVLYAFQVSTTTTTSPTDPSYGVPGLAPGTYVAELTDNLGCVTLYTFTVSSTSSKVGCTDPDALNYDPNAVCDCCCQLEGCMDPNSVNYNPNATIPGQCDYPDVPPSPCIPDSLSDNKTKLKACLAQKGTKWLNEYKMGRGNDCSLMNKWKLILINYLLDQTDLSCLFNCADIGTPPVTAVQDCNALWVAGGPSTGLNHNTNHLGGSIVNSGEGTTITQYDGYPLGWFGQDPSSNPANNFTYVGDVVKFDLPTGHPLATWLNGTIWTLSSPVPNSPTGLHTGCERAKITHYTQCLDYRTVSVTTNINYYDKFINFVNKFCADCNIKTLKDTTQPVTAATTKRTQTKNY